MSNAKIALYSMMENMVAAGIPLQKILSGPVPHALQAPCRHVAELLQNGESLATAMRLTHAFSDMEIALVYAGEATGTLDQSARALRDMFEQQKAFKSQIASALLQPALTYFAAGPLLKIIELAQESAGKGGVDFASWCGPLLIRCILWWGAPVAILLALKCLGPVIARSAPLGSIATAVPFFGKLQHRIASAGFWRTFSTGVAAGIPYTHAIKLAAKACKNLFYRQHFLAMADMMENNQLSLSDAFTAIANSHDFSAQYTSFIASGEQTGTIDTASAQIAQMAQQDAETSLKRFATICPVLLYVVLAGYLAFKIISFYAGYIGQLTNM